MAWSLKFSFARSIVDQNRRSIVEYEIIFVHSAVIAYTGWSAWNRDAPSNGITTMAVFFILSSKLQNHKSLSAGTTACRRKKRKKIFCNAVNFDFRRPPPAFGRPRHCGVPAVFTMQPGYLNVPLGSVIDWHRCHGWKTLLAAYVYAGNTRWKCVSSSYRQGLSANNFSLKNFADHQVTYNEGVIYFLGVFLKIKKKTWQIGHITIQYYQIFNFIC